MNLWAYMKAPTKHHMSSCTTRRGELGMFLVGVGISAIGVALILGCTIIIIGLKRP